MFNLIHNPNPLPVRDKPAECVLVEIKQFILGLMWREAVIHAWRNNVCRAVRKTQQLLSEIIAGFDFT